MLTTDLLRTAKIFSIALLAVLPTLGAAALPNIVYILADDLGYGDVQCLAPETSKIATPKMDAIAKAGIVFTNAHSSSSVCTPTRYSVLTGRYNWRTHLQEHVIWGYSPPLIAEGRATVPSVLRDQGYATACIGKWHIGMILPTTDGVLPKGRSPKAVNIVWDGVIEQGPIDRGFDHFYGISASLDMAPYIYIEDDRFVGEMPEGRTRQPGFDSSDVLAEIGRKTVAHIEKQSADKPFFVYVPLTSPHTPIVPSAEWKVKSPHGKYGDFVMETDHVIGLIADAIEASDFGDNTLLIVTSDNGCSRAAGISKLGRDHGHYPSAQFRGSKADLWDGGHRVPFLVRWPAKVKPGGSTDELICLTDLMATAAELSGAKLTDNAGEDSVSFAPALEGKPITSDRAGVVHHSIDGFFAYRKGPWKLLLSRGSAGWTAPKEASFEDDVPDGQLYQMDNDPGEQNNLFQENPEIVAELLKQLESDVTRGRSTSGPDQPNNVDEIVLWKNKKAH